jgi:hypothetical protein
MNSARNTILINFLLFAVYRFQNLTLLVREDTLRIFNACRPLKYSPVAARGGQGVIAPGASGRGAKTGWPLTILLLASFFLVIFTPKMKTQPKTCARDTFAFVNDMKRKGDECESVLFVNTTVAKFSMSATYRKLKPVFDTAVVQSGFIEAAEGHSGRLRVQTLALHYMASMPFVHTVCETGFNAGHSAFNYLTANPRLVMHSFELGQYGYSARVAQNLSEMFPRRFVYHVGDSRKSVPEFIAKNPSVKCSLISVDGGHVYPVALADALNLASVADIENGAIIAFDDYPSPNNHGPAWDYVVKLGYVEEVSFCRFTHRGGLGHAPGFAFRIVVRRSDRASLMSLLKP